MLVIKGLEGVSSMGGISASIGLRRCYRGRRRARHSSFAEPRIPDLVSRREPITGKWRIETASINQPVSICGVTVSPGDLVAADETGVCFVPHRDAGVVLARAQAITADERARLAEIDSGVPIAELTPRKPTR